MGTDACTSSPSPKLDLPLSVEHTSFLQALMCLQIHRRLSDPQRCRSSSSSVTVLLSSKSFTARSEPSNGKVGEKDLTIQFDIWAARFSLPLPQSQDEIPQPMEILWHRRGEHVPISRNTIVHASAPLNRRSVYRPMGKPAPPSLRTFTRRTRTIPRPDENLDKTKNGLTKPPPYS